MICELPLARYLCFLFIFSYFHYLIIFLHEIFIFLNSCSLTHTYFAQKTPCISYIFLKYILSAISLVYYSIKYQVISLVKNFLNSLIAESKNFGTPESRDKRYYNKSIVGIENNFFVTTAILYLSVSNLGCPKKLKILWPGANDGWGNFNFRTLRHSSFLLPSVIEFFMEKSCFFGTPYWQDYIKT